MHFLPVLLLVVTIGSPLLLGHFLLQSYIRKQRQIMAAISSPYVSQEIFCTLPLEIQLCVIRDEGTFLAQRQQQEASVLLYHLHGQFFCEVHQQADTHEVLAIHTFTDSAALEHYATTIRLDEVLTQ